MKRNKPNRLLFLLIALMVIFVGVLGIFAALESLVEPVNEANHETRVFVVRKGQAISAIAQELAEKGLIKHPLGFRYVVYRYHLSKNIQAGSFKLSQAMSVIDIAKTMTRGSEDVWVTILEGWRREETAAALEKAFQAKNSPFNAQKFLELTKDKEGFLYPDTYLIPVAASEAAVVSLITTTFNQKVLDDLGGDLRRSDKNIEAVITMASIIEREARSETSRKMVSGILWKRLENGWPLQVDASLQYAIGQDPIKGTWWREPVAADKAVNSPYNTYKHQGLPPGPICSPSLSAIQAALNPTPSDYWFYLTGNDNQMHYAVTAEEHTQNIANYLQ